MRLAISRSWNYLGGHYLVFAPYSNGSIATSDDLMMAWSKHSWWWPRLLLTSGTLSILTLPLLLPLVGTTQYGDPLAFGWAVLAFSAMLMMPGSLRRIGAPERGLPWFLFLTTVEILAIVAVINDWTPSDKRDFLFLDANVLIGIFWGVAIASFSDLVAKAISVYLFIRGEFGQRVDLVYKPSGEI